VPAADPPELQEVGRTIRRLRQETGWSMSALAERAGLSQPFISQLESGAHTPSLQTLYRVAAALDVAPGDLFGDARPLQGWVRHEPSQIISSETAHAPVATVLVPGGGGSQLEAYEWEVRPGDADHQWWQHDGEDLIYVISGAVQVEMQGSPPQLLRERESAHLVETQRPHRWTAVPGEPARLLLVVTTPHEKRDR
jgi:transcriptional regulator with XRE-family HTH domain